MTITKTKVVMPNGISAIKIEGFGLLPIYLKPVKVLSASTSNSDGVHRILKARVYELNAAGEEIAGLEGPIFAVTINGDAIAAGKSLSTQLSILRRGAITAFLSSKKLSNEVIPDNLSDVEGEI